MIKAETNQTEHQQASISYDEFCKILKLFLLLE